MNPLGFLDFGLLDFLETLIIAGALVGVYRWIRGTYAIRAGVGILFLLLINFIIRLFGFTTIDFILSAILDVGILAVFIIFQPEIRGLLYRIGQNPSIRLFGGKSSTEQVIDEVMNAVKHMSKEYIGALIVFASPSKSQIRVLQSIGRGLRKTDDGKSTTLYDIVDDISWKSRKNYGILHADERLRIYGREKFKHKTYRVDL